MTLRSLWFRTKLLISRAYGTRMVYGYVRGDGTYLANTRVSNSLAGFSLDRMQIADHVFIGHFSVLDATWGLTIDEGAQIGFFTGIFTHSSHAAVRLYGDKYLGAEHKVAYFTGPVHIGAYSFIGAHVTILPGTTIGKGSIVKALSLVKGTFPDFAIIDGNPAKVVGDTRELDATLLKRHPALRVSYEAWAGDTLEGYKSERARNVVH